MCWAQWTKYKWSNNSKLCYRCVLNNQQFETKTGNSNAGLLPTYAIFFTNRKDCSPLIWPAFCVRPHLLTALFQVLLKGVIGLSHPTLLLYTMLTYDGLYYRISTTLDYFYLDLIHMYGYYSNYGFIAYTGHWQIHLKPLKMQKKNYMIWW